MALRHKAQSGSDRQTVVCVRMGVPAVSSGCVWEKTIERGQLGGGVGRKMQKTAEKHYSNECCVQEKWM